MRRATQKRYLSRRALENRLARRLFAAPWQDYDDLYWLKYVQADTRTVVVVRPDRSGQQTMSVADGREPLYESLLEALAQVAEQDVVRHLGKSEIVLLDLDEDDENLVTFSVIDLETDL